MSRVDAGTDCEELGAYGFRVGGAVPAARYLTPACPTWPLLTVEREIGPHDVEHSWLVDDQQLQYCTRDQTDQIGGVRMRRDPLTVRFTSPGGFSEPAMIHPDLAALAAVANWWRGRDSYHAGAFVLDGGAWAVAGAREAGKSTLLALLAAKGVGVLADDVVVVDEEVRVLAGPRCVDLREGAASWLGTGEDIGMVGARRRWRVDLPSVEAAVPLRGWVVPAWGDEIGFSEIPGRDRFEVLIANHYLATEPCDPAGFLDILATPFLEFRRPQRWDAADASLTALLDHLRSTVS